MPAIVDCGGAPSACAWLSSNRHDTAEKKSHWSSQSRARFYRRHASGEPPRTPAHRPRSRDTGHLTGGHSAESGRRFGGGATRKAEAAGFTADHAARSLSRLPGCISRHAGGYSTNGRHGANCALAHSSAYPIDPSPWCGGLPAGAIATNGNPQQPQRLQGFATRDINQWRSKATPS